MIAQEVVEDQRQVCAALLVSDEQRWVQLEKRFTAFIAEEKERQAERDKQRAKRDETLDRAVLDIVRIDQRWQHLPTIVTIAAMMSVIALVISVAALVVAVSR